MAHTIMRVKIVVGVSYAEQKNGPDLKRARC